MSNMARRGLIVSIIISSVGLCSGLNCYDGHAEGSSASDLTNFTTSACTEHETWCFSLHGKRGDYILDIKSCWNQDWEGGRYRNDGCIKGQHCLNGICYENATACLCNTDGCNGWTEGGNITTPMPADPTPPPSGWHTCYYGVEDENGTASLDAQQQCMNGEQLCVRVTQAEKKYEYRSCWDSRFNEEFSRPGCYKNFQHCHRDHCFNDTTICVCADPLCNSAEYSSEAPPITPGSGLYCFGGDWEEESYYPRECRSNEEFCIEFLSEESNRTYRDCWDPAYDPKYNYTGCEVTQSCFRGSCYNSTVCVCQDNLCNSFGMADHNGTTEVPTDMTTTNTTMHCWYGMDVNTTDHTSDHWQAEVCGPEEHLCLTVVSHTGFSMGQCYSEKYNDGKYTEGCYDTGEHCWDNQCHTGSLCLCDSPMCNVPGASTPAPHPTTAGSGLKCYYGVEGGHDHHQTNLTIQDCNRNETLCLAVYGVDDDFFMSSCWDPHKEGGRYNSTEGCLSGLHCWHMEDGNQDCHNGTVCTCNDNLCNGKNASSTLPPETTPPINTTFSCWFGERHPHTGDENWVLEECLPTETHCFQLVHGHGEERFESRECWDLKYEDNKYSGDGCYRGEFCHHEHCFNDTTVCICDKSECNDWTEGGNVTTDSPVTNPSQFLCYSGTFSNYQVKQCSWSETMCMYFDDGTDENVNCYDPKTNNGRFTSNDCWNNVEVEQYHDHKGRLCLCSDDDLCNEDFFKKPANGTTRVAATILLPLLALITRALHWL